MTFIDLSSLQTEGQNPRTTAIDQVSTTELCHLINAEDADVASTVVPCIPHIARAIDALAERVRRGGRVIYIGAGTSGRLGVVDASEIPPTFSAPHGQFIALMAGGDDAMRMAQEGAEDDTDGARRDLEPLDLNPELDSLIGIAASGRTPYVLGGMEHAKKMGCVTVGVACSDPSTMSVSDVADFMIAPVTGPEVVTGSTRMKAGTATKLVLNMLSTGIMIRIGKTYGNMMVDLKTSNLKLQQRSRNIVRTISGSSCPSTDAEIDALLERCGGSVKLSLATLALGSDPESAQKSLDLAAGKLSAVMENPTGGSTTDAAAYGPLVMYVDGGGTKCAAVIINSKGEVGEGEAGPCNVADSTLDTSVSSIKLAAERALDSLSKSGSTPKNLKFKSIQFAAVWVGLAGCDRPGVKFSLKEKLLKTFQFTNDKILKLSNDIEVLASAADKTTSQSAITLVAGTGSIAIRYHLEPQDSGTAWARNARSGGWGHLLGDEGGGFDIGRQAIRSALYSLDTLRGSADRGSPVTSEDIKQHLSPLSKKVLEHFGVSESSLNDYDLLSAILFSAGTTIDSNPKYKVAQVARLVLNAYAPPTTTEAKDKDAEEIILTAVAGLVRTLKPLLAAPFDATRSALVLSGGLLSSENPGYRSAVVSELGKAGIAFETIETVKNPAKLGAEVLARQHL